MDFNPLHFTDPTDCISEAINISSQIRRRSDDGIESMNFEILVSQTKRMLDIGVPVTAQKMKLREYRGDQAFYNVDGRVAWLVTDTGDYVLGSIGVPPHPSVAAYGVNYMYEIGDGVWGLGELIRANTASRVFTITAENRLRRAYDSTQSMPTIRETRRSDGAAPRGEIEQPTVLYRVAPWTLKMFPAHGISDEHRNLLLTAAEAEYRRRVGMYGVQLQAHRRGWDDEYRKNVRENGDVDFPDPTFMSGVEVRVITEPEVNTPEMRQARDLLRSSGVSVEFTSEKRLTIEAVVSETRSARAQQDVLLREAVRRLPGESIRGMHILSQSDFMISMGAHR